MPLAKRTTQRRSLARFPSRTATLVALLVVSFGALGHAAAGPIRGRINGQEKLVPEVYIEAAKPDAHRYTWREPSPTVRPEFRVLSANPTRDICVAAIGTSPAPPHEPILVKLTGGHTIPTTLVVSPGTRITFENRDPFPHRLFAVGVQAWKAETMNPSARREWTAPQGGKVEFRDELFSTVRLHVIVEPMVVDTAYPNRDGAFTLSVPAGDFVLKTFFAGKQVGKPVSVTARDKVVFDLKDPMNVGEDVK